MKFTDQEKVTLAALLHDIGKFRQRAEILVNDKMIGLCCPSKDGHPTHIHAAHTGHFFDLFDKAGILDPRDFDEKISDLDYIGNISAQHHRADESHLLQYIVKIADWFSSGFDREPTFGSKKNKKRLQTVFSDVVLENEQKEKAFYSLQKLNAGIEPKKEVEFADSNLLEEYKTLWEEFEKEITVFNPQGGFENFLGGFQSLLENYTWCIPASNHHEYYPNCSLYDHLVTTAAIAGSIYGWADSQGISSGEELKKHLDQNAEVFRFAQGDFSGIQKFIFKHNGSSSRFSAKLLRARSFFVSFVVRVVAMEVCKKFGVYSTNIIMNAGGKFLILVPNLKNSSEILSEIRKEVNAYFSNLNFGETRFHLGSVSCSKEYFRSELQAQKSGVHYKSLLGKLHREMAKQKAKWFSPVQVYSHYLDDVDKADQKLCSLCDIHPAQEVFFKDNEQAIYICSHCKSFKDLGTELVKDNLNFIYYFSDNKGDYQLPFGCSFKLKKHAKVEKNEQIFDVSGERFHGYTVLRIGAYVPKIVYRDLSEEKYCLDKNESRFEQLSEMEEGDTKSFLMLARDSLSPCENPDDGFQGREYLSVLKADVDNLGEIFIRGFRRHDSDTTTISKSLYLSRMMDFFFTTELQQVIQSKYPSIYTVFAGGDDLFLIGAWTQVHDFAAELPERLQKYVGNQEDFHLSCGLLLARPSLPVFAMAHRAEEELEKAKAHDLNGKKKNAVTIHGETMKWSELKEVYPLRNDFLELESQKVSYKFLYRFFTFINMHEKSRQKPELLRWRALFQYLVYRNYRGKEDLIQKLLPIPDGMIDRFGRKLRVPLSEFMYRRRK